MMLLNSDQMGRAATSAAIAGAATAAIDGMASSVRIPRLDTTVPLYAASAAGGAMSSMVASVVHDTLIPALAAEDKWTEGVPTMVGLGAAAAGNSAYWYMLDPRLPEQLGWNRLIGLGVISDFLGSQLYDRVLKQQMM